MNNRSAREMLEKIYGKKCMIHQGIRKINPPTPKKGRYTGNIPSQLTFHHLYPKHLGGAATPQNGAVLCRKCHDWLEQLSKEERETVNDELRAYKRMKVVFDDELDLDVEAKTIFFEPQQIFKERETKKKELADKKAKKYEEKRIKREMLEYIDR